MAEPRRWNRIVIGAFGEAKRRGLTRILAYDLENESVIRVGQKFGFKLAPKEPRTNYSMLKAEIGV